MIPQRKTSKERTKLVSFHEGWKMRNTCLTEEVLNVLVENLKLGMPVNHCCALAGISELTYSSWLERGEKYEKNAREGIPDEGELLYGFFKQQVTLAQAEWQKGIFTSSFTGDRYKPNWVRDMTILERRDRRNWSKSDTQNVRISVVEPDYKFL